MNKRLKKKTYQYSLLLFYSKIGEIANISSMIEYNLIQIISEKTLLGKLDKKKSVLLLELKKYISEANTTYDTLNEYSRLQELIDDAFGRHGISRELKNRLQIARKKRNYYIHEIFQEDLKDRKWIFNNPKNYFREMDAFIFELHLLNNGLISIDRENRNAIKLWN